MSNKTPKTYEEQLEILKKMGIPKRWENERISSEQRMHKRKKCCLR